MIMQGRGEGGPTGQGEKALAGTWGQAYFGTEGVRVP